MLLCPYCSFSNPETATHCLGCGNDLPPDVGLGLSIAEMAQHASDTEDLHSASVDEDSITNGKRRIAGSFAAKDDQDVLGDMDAALHTLLRDDLTMGGKTPNETRKSTKNRSKPGSQTLRPRRHTQANQTSTGDDQTHLSPRARTGKHLRPNIPNSKTIASDLPPGTHREDEFTAISPVDPETWEGIVKQARQGLRNEDSDTPVPPPAHTMPPSMARHTQRAEAPTAKNSLPRPPMINQPPTHRPTATTVSPRSTHKPETTERIDLKELQSLIVEDDLESAPNDTPQSTASTSQASTHQPDATDRMAPSSWAEIALARQRNTKSVKRERTNVENIEELGMESIVEEEDERTVADPGKLSQIRDKLFRQWEQQQPADTAKEPAPYRGYKEDTEDDADEEPAATPRELQGARGVILDTSEHIDVEEHDHTLGAASLGDADALLAQAESSWGLRRPQPQDQTPSDDHTLGAASHEDPDHETGRWFEGEPSDQPQQPYPDHASTLLGGTSPRRATPPNDTLPPLDQVVTQKTRTIAAEQDTTTYLSIVLDVEAPGSDNVLRKSTRMQALEGLGERIAEKLQEADLFVEQREDERLLASIEGNRQGISQAILAAQQTIDEINRYDVPVAARIRVRCVISTVTSALAQPQERALGISGRLLRGMPVDRIWLDWTSYCALQESQRCQEVVLPSLEEPAYEVENLDASTEQRAADNDPEETLPWIGRQSEFDTLQHHWNSAKNGESRLVLVLGSPGSGRSRLLDIFCQQAGHGAFLFRGSSQSCPSEANTSPYLAGLLLSYLQHHHIDRNRGLRQQVAALAGADGTISEQREERMAQLLLELSAEGPNDDNGATEQALEWLIRASTSQMPVIAIFDDIFLLERRTSRLLDSLLKQLPPRSMIILLSTPGEYEEVLFSSLSQAQRIELPALTPQESRQLLNYLQLPNDVSHKQIDRMVDEAEGNPRLLVTLAQATRKSQQREITWSYDLAVPNVIERLMLQRQRGLTHLEKDTLRKAAVIGDRFWKGAVECLERLELNDGSWGLREGITISNVDDRSSCLKMLVDKELLQRVPHSSLPNEQEYRFPHRLLRRILMRQIPLSIRQQMHRHLAQWLSLRDDAHVLAFEIARHLKRAGDPEGATWRLYESARDVLAEQRYTQALSLLAEALETLGDRNPVLRLQLLNASAHAYEYVGDINAAIQLFESALQLSWRLTSASWGGRIFVALSRCLTLRGEVKTAQGFVLDAQTLARQCNDQATICGARIQAIHIALLQGDLNEAEITFPETQSMMQSIKHKEPLMWAHMLATEGWMHRLKSRWREAIKALQEAGNVRREANDNAAYATSLLDQAEFYMTAGDEDSAIPLLDEANDSLRQSEAYFALQHGLLMTAQIALSRRDTHKALEALGEAWKHCQMSGEPGMIAQVSAALAATYVLHRQPTEAMRFAKIAIQRLKEGPSRVRATTYHFLGEAASSMSPEQLDEMFNPTPPRLPEGGMPTFLFLKSVELYKRAKEAARQIGTLLSLGRSLLIGGHQQTAINVLDRGIADAKKLGLGLLLERLRNQRRLLSQDDAPNPSSPLDSASSTLVVRKNRQMQQKAPFASETQSQPAPHANQPNPYLRNTNNSINPYNNETPRHAAPPNPYISNNEHHPNQSTNILPSPQRPPRHPHKKEKP